MTTEGGGLTFAELLRIARSTSAEDFVRKLDCPFLVATGALGGAVRPGRETKETGVLHLDGSPSHSVGSKHPMAGRIVAVRKRKGSVRDPARITVGRAADNDLVIDDRSVSAHHAHFERQGELLFVIDAGSRNGTCVNLARLEAGQPCAVKDEDVVTFGRVSFQFFTPLPLYYALKAFVEGAT